MSAGAATPATGQPGQALAKPANTTPTPAKAESTDMAQPAPNPRTVTTAGTTPKAAGMHEAAKQQ